MELNAQTIIIVTTVITSISGLLLAFVNLRGQQKIQERQMNTQQAMEASRSATMLQQSAAQFEAQREQRDSDTARQLRDELKRDRDQYRDMAETAQRAYEGCTRLHLRMEAEINRLRAAAGEPPLDIPIEPLEPQRPSMSPQPGSFGPSGPSNPSGPMGPAPGALR